MRKAKEHYGSRIPLLCLDAECLPFCDGAFDTVILFEALYYLPSPAKFVEECRRILSPDGELLVCTVNREWSGFSPSLGSIRYYSASELRTLLESASFRPEFFAGFPANDSSSLSRAIGVLRAIAVRLHLVPKTLKGRELLKRIFYGRLEPIGEEVTEGMADVEPPAAIPGQGPESCHKIIYVAASPVIRNSETPA